MKIKISPMRLEGIWKIEPNIIYDTRGFLFEAYNKKEFESAGMVDTFVQENHIGCKRNTIRGLHFQKDPYATSKLVRCVVGEILDVVVDMRKNSPTFGKWDSIILNTENRLMVYVPAGFAHGVCGLNEWSEIIYKMNNFFMPEYDRGVRWNDPDIGIIWPIQNPIISDKDARQPFLKDL